MLKFLSDKQNLVFVRVYSQVSSMRYKLTCTCRKDSNQYEHPQNLISLSFPSRVTFDSWHRADVQADLSLQLEHMPTCIF